MPFYLFEIHPCHYIFNKFLFHSFISLFLFFNQYQIDLMKRFCHVDESVLISIAENLQKCLNSTHCSPNGSTWLLHLFVIAFFVSYVSFNILQCIYIFCQLVNTVTLFYILFEQIVDKGKITEFSTMYNVKIFRFFTSFKVSLYNGKVYILFNEKEQKFLL